MESGCAVKLELVLQMSDQCYNLYCDEAVRSKGLCELHYDRFIRRGTTYDPLNDPEPRRGYTEKPRNKNDPSTWRKHLTSNGYVVLVYSDADGRKEIREHRWVMSQHLGRDLLPEETVHHINGVRTDNRISNLELWSSAHPRGQRVEDKIEWAESLLALYAPEKLR